MPKLLENRDGHSELLLPKFEYAPLNQEAQEARFLVLQPCSGDKNDEDNHVICSLEVQSLANAIPFIAVKNARGYRKLQGAIEVNDKVMLISKSLELFLRHFRRSNEPVRLWVRHICLQEYDRGEQQRYWTRAYSDEMYSRATSVVNMKDYLSDLLDKRVITTVHDSRYREWTKEWGQVPSGKMLLPSVYPIVLGKRMSNESPVDQFDYVPLDRVADEIRIIVLTSTKDVSAPLVMHVAHCPAHCEVGFHGLSYTWGTQEPTEQIVLNGQKLLIRKNLADALRSMRRQESKIAIWIDALSIDQQNDEERSRQLERIFHVYDCAQVVICYVGSRDDTSDIALDFVRNLQEPTMRVVNDKWDIGKGKKVSPEELPRQCAALYRFLTRPYFRRIWILQEIAAASVPVVTCGDRFDTMMEKLDMATHNLLDMMNRDPDLGPQMLNAMPELGEISARELMFIRKMFYFRHLNSHGANQTMIMPTAKISPTSPGYLEAAIIARDFQASDPRDKIFALWNLARDKDGMKFDMTYTESVQKTYQNFTRAWTDQHGSLDIIGAAEINPDSSDFYSTAPSWCPDWSTPSRASCLIRREDLPNRFMAIIDAIDGVLYSADGGMQQQTPDQYFSIEGNALLCSAIILDRIAHVFDEPPEPPGGMRFHGFDPFIDWKLTHYVRQIQTHHFFSDSTSPYSSPAQAATVMFHGDTVSARTHRGDNPEMVDSSYPDEEYVRLPSLSGHVLRNADIDSYFDLHAVLRSILRGRVLFVSESGYIGLAPEYVRDAEPAKEHEPAETTEPDQTPELAKTPQPSTKAKPAKPYLLAILATCSVPVLLQEQDDGESYRFCGTCFVQGWMEGEMLTDPMGFDLPKEFWEAMQGSERIRIV